MATHPAGARQTIAQALEAFLRKTHIRHVHFAQASVAPPLLAYITSFPRLSVPLTGRHPTEIAHEGQTIRVPLSRGEVLFAGRNCWNKPDWSTPVKLLTFLFGKKQIGISMVTHDGRREEPASAIKTTLSPFEGATQHVLSALATLEGESRTSPLDRLLTESLLHSCLHLLASRTESHPRKAAHTYDAICLYVQENFQNPISRESVAHNFGLTPNHVSRLFRHEGSMGFSDYLTLVRMDRAKFMLKEYGSPLKEIAANCGYQDVAYFCRVFRRMTKITPTEYRVTGL